MAGDTQTRTGVTRRWLLGTGGGVAAATLAACGGASTTGQGAGAARKPRDQ